MLRSLRVKCENGSCSERPPHLRGQVWGVVGASEAASRLEDCESHSNRGSLMDGSADQSCASLSSWDPAASRPPLFPGAGQKPCAASVSMALGSSARHTSQGSKELQRLHKTTIRAIHQAKVNRTARPFHFRPQMQTMT